MGKVVLKTWSIVRARGMVYKAFVQLLFLYGSESWVVMGAILKAIEVFHYLAAIIITGVKRWSTASGKWEVGVAPGR